jgi:NDP-sugar pyrophosphorylase family protein
LVLAAGRGERLRPLTTFVPKVLLPVAGRPVIDWSLGRLAALGCEAAAVNLHHLADEVERRLGKSHRGMPLHYSRELQLLGTLGALRPLRDFLAQADLVLLLNGDSLCRWPLARLIRRHQATGAEVTLLLSSEADRAAFGGGVEVDEAGRVVELRPKSPFRAAGAGASKRRRYVFAGAHVLSPALLSRVGEGEGPSDIVDGLYHPLLRSGGRIETLLTAADWHDVGTPRRYLEAAYEWGARGRFPRRLWRRRYVARGASVGPRARIRRSVVERGSRIERAATVERSLVLDDAVIGHESRLVECIVAPGVRLPPRTWIERRLITPLKAGRDPGANDSVVGHLVYTPM